MRDITNRGDIDLLVEVFYGKAMDDDVIGYIFTDVAKLDLGEHLPVIADFWEMLLFRTVNFQEKYGRSPMSTHIVLNRKEPLTREHFERWLKLFCGTVDELFAGETAELAKFRAVSVAKTMMIRFSAESAGGIPVVQG